MSRFSSGESETRESTYMGADGQIRRHSDGKPVGSPSASRGYHERQAKRQAREHREIGDALDKIELDVDLAAADREIAQLRAARLENENAQRLAQQDRDLARRIDPDAASQERMAAVAAVQNRFRPSPDEVRTASLRVTEQRETYRKNGPHSFFRDFVALRTGNFSPTSEGAEQRLRDHAAETEVRRRESGSANEYRADLNRTVGTGGSFSLPQWLIGDWVAAERPGRNFANVVTRMPLPNGAVTSVSVPRLSTGFTVASQTADNAAVSDGSAGFVDAALSAPVRTVPGQAFISQQLLDQSPINFDEVIAADLRAAYDAELDRQLLQGSGASGQHLGILGTSGAQVVTNSDTSQGAKELFISVSNAIQLCWNARLRGGPSVIVAHPRRYSAFTAMSDSSNRPVFVPSAAPLSVNGVLDLEALLANGFVGTLAGYPVLLDENVTTTNNSNQDVIYVLRAGDNMLLEGLPYLTVNEDNVKSTNLEVAIRLHVYSAFIPRLPNALVSIQGAGLASPSFP